LALRVVVRVTGADRGVAAEAVIALACLGLAVLGSWLLYRVVELPGMRLLRPRPVRPPVR
jgi:peptidoglycan/LPS O-acetylase OafA/YrhL